MLKAIGIGFLVSLNWLWLVYIQSSLVGFSFLREFTPCERSDISNIISRVVGMYSQKIINDWNSLVLLSLDIVLLVIALICRSVNDSVDGINADTDT